MSGRTLENVHAGLEPRLTACNGQFPTLALAKRITLLHAAVLPAFLGAQSTDDATRSISKAVTRVPITQIRIQSKFQAKRNFSKKSYTVSASILLTSTFAPKSSSVANGRHSMLGQAATPSSFLVHTGVE